LEDWTVWEIVAYVDGRNEAYAADSKPEAMGNDEFEQLLATHNINSVN
jgi:hypothetical protein